MIIGDAMTAAFSPRETQIVLAEALITTLVVQQFVQSIRVSARIPVLFL